MGTVSYEERMKRLKDASEARSRESRRASATRASSAGQPGELHRVPPRSCIAKATTITAHRGLSTRIHRTGKSSRASRCRWRSSRSNSWTRFRRGRCWSSPARNGHALLESGSLTRRRRPKELFVVEGATHIDLYDRAQHVTPAVTKLAAFFSQHLSSGAAK